MKPVCAFCTWRVSRAISAQVHYTSGSIVPIVGAQTIALFFTGSQHAGENTAEVPKKRSRELSPIQMRDALSRNSSKLARVKALLANCLAHGCAR
jgi:transposase